MIKLIASDIDGTLLKGYSGEISPEAINLIKLFKEKDILFVASSGRQLPNLHILFEQVKNDIAYIAENGSIIKYNNEVLFKSIINYDLALKLAKKILNHKDCEVLVSTENTTYIMPKTESFFKYIKYDVKNDITVVNNLNEINDEILKISLFNEDGISTNLLNEILPDFENKFQSACSGLKWYDFMNLNTHKGNALKILGNALNISSKNMVAFGDNFNDFEMLSFVDHSYAMKDSHNEIKSISKYSCDNVEKSLKEIYNKFCI